MESSFLAKRAEISAKILLQMQRSKVYTRFVIAHTDHRKPGDNFDRVARNGIRRAQQITQIQAM